MNKLLLASLLTVSSTVVTVPATAETPKAPPQRPTLGCHLATVATTPLFRIDRGSTRVPGYTATSLVILSNGAWTYQETPHGAMPPPVLGCLGAADLASLKTTLANASWKVTYAQFRCKAIATDYTQYSQNGVPVLKSEICDGKILDASTQKALDVANAIAAKLPKR